MHSSAIGINEVIKESIENLMYLKNIDKSLTTGWYDGWYR